MRKQLCPQCSIANLYLKNDNGERLLIFVTSDLAIVSAKEGTSLDGFDTDTIYCLGCSWSGSVADLSRY